MDNDNKWNSMLESMRALEHQEAFKMADFIANNNKLPLKRSPTEIQEQEIKKRLEEFLVDKNKKKFRGYWLSEEALLGLSESMFVLGVKVSRNED